MRLKHFCGSSFLVGIFSALTGLNATQDESSIDLDEITAALQSYETSVSSFSLRYRSEVTVNPRSWKRMFELDREKRERQEPGDNAEEAPQPFVEQYELDVDGDKIRHKSPSGMRKSQIRTFDGNQGSQIILDEDNPRGGAVNLTAQQIRIDPSCPAIVAGLRCGPKRPALYEELDPALTAFVGQKRVEGQLTYSVVKRGKTEEATTWHLFFDPAHDFVPARIERVKPNGEKWTIISVKRFSQYPNRATGEARWFPSEILYENYISPLPGELHSTHRIVVEAMEFNPILKDETFTLVMPDGLRIADAETHGTRITGRPALRTELADKAANDAREQLRVAMNAAENTKTRASFHRINWFSWIAGVAGAGGLLAILIGSWQRFRKG